MLEGNLLFAASEGVVDRHLFALAAISGASHDCTDAKALQNWLSDVIGHLEALPEPIQIALGLALFKIGDEHFHWRADQIKSWHKERCRSLRQQLSDLQREQWQSPVGALPSRFRMTPAGSEGDKLASAGADDRQKIVSLIAVADVFQGGAARHASRPFLRDAASAPPLRRRRSRLVVTGGIATLIIAVVVDAVALGQSPFPALSQETGDRSPLLVQSSRVTSGKPAFLGLTLQGRANDAVVMITGLVPGMTLTTGSKIGVDTWKVPETALPNAWIVPPTNFVGVVDLVAELHLADGTMVDRRRIKLEWQAPIPGPAAESQTVTTEGTAVAPVSEQNVAPSGQRDADEIVMLLKRGQELMRNGDLAAARLVLRHAAEAKSAEAALTLGETYDPVILRELKVYGFSADVGMARTWYEKAKELGSPEAARRLDILARFAR